MLTLTWGYVTNLYKRRITCITLVEKDKTMWTFKLILCFVLTLFTAYNIIAATLADSKDEGSYHLGWAMLTVLALQGILP